MQNKCHFWTFVKKQCMHPPGCKSNTIFLKLQRHIFIHYLGLPEYLHMFTGQYEVAICKIPGFCTWQKLLSPHCTCSTIFGSAPFPTLVFYQWLSSLTVPAVANPYIMSYWRIAKPSGEPLIVSAHLIHALINAASQSHLPYFCSHNL